MSRIISLRAVAILIAVIGGAKLVIPLLDGADVSKGGSGFQLYNFIGPVLAAKVEESEAAINEPQQCKTPEEIFMAISDERALLDKQKAEIEERLANVSLAEEKLKQNTTRLGQLKKDLEDLFERAKQAKTDDLKRLVKIYRGMKPKESATIMNTMDIEVAVLVLGEMKERDAAPIFAKMNLVRAQAISKIIFERSKLPGDQNLNGIALQ